MVVPLYPGQWRPGEAGMSFGYIAQRYQERSEAEQRKTMDIVCGLCKRMMMSQAAESLGAM